MFLNRWLGGWLARYLNQPLDSYEKFAVVDKHYLKSTLQPGDILLVEGNTRISTAIKYLTQSTWSHACIYVGDQFGDKPLVEADLVNGITTVAIDRYALLNTRICRPVGLSEEDLKNVLSFVTARLGYQYDLKNIFDLARYLFPTPPVPVRFRRKMLEFGSGDPTKAICSSLIAQAFQSVGYPILPRTSEYTKDLDGGADDVADKNIEENVIEVVVDSNESKLGLDQALLERRHYSYFTPRDFDVSPYFQVVKPTIEHHFDYKQIKWAVTEDEGETS